MVFENDEHVVICSVFIIINQIILLLVNILLDDSISTSHWFYHFLLIYFQFYWMISSINLLCYLLFWFYKYEWYYQNRYWYQNSFQILVSKWYMKSISILIVYYLQQSSILSILDLHQISKNRRNIYSFIHIHNNTSDWFGCDILEWIRKTNCLKIRNIYSSFNHSISN